MQFSDETTFILGSALEQAVSRAPIALRALLIATPEGHGFGATRLGMRVLTALDEAGWELQGANALNIVVSGFEAAGGTQLADMAAGSDKARLSVAHHVAAGLTLHNAKLARRDLVA